MFVGRIVVYVAVLEICARDVMHVRENCFMLQKGKPVLFLSVSGMTEGCMIVEIVQKFHVRYGCVQETQSIPMRNLRKM